MHDYGNFEKVGSLPKSLPRNDKQISTEPGDIILYQGNQITIYYDVISGPRTTGDGYYESCILDFENNQIEITV